MPPVAAAIVPHPPLLVPELASGAAAELDALRAACREALLEVLAAAPNLVLVGDGPVWGRAAPGASGSFRGYGADLEVSLPASLEVVAAETRAVQDSPVTAVRTGLHPVPLDHRRGGTEPPAGPEPPEHPSGGPAPGPSDDPTPGRLGGPAKGSQGGLVAVPPVPPGGPTPASPGGPTPASPGGPTPVPPGVPGLHDAGPPAGSGEPGAGPPGGAGAAGEPGGSWGRELPGIGVRPAGAWSGSERRLARLRVGERSGLPEPTMLDRLPLSLAVAAWLLAELDQRPRQLVAFAVPGSVGPGAAAAIGQTLAGWEGPLGVVAVGDLSACRTDRAPGAFDPRAGPFDAAVADAVAAGRPGDLLGLDPVVAAELLVAGRVPLQVLAGAFDGIAADGRVLYQDAPYGVGYLVGVLTAR